MICDHPSIKRLTTITKEYSVIIMIAGNLASGDLLIPGDSNDIKPFDKEILSFFCLLQPNNYQLTYPDLLITQRYESGDREI